MSASITSSQAQPPSQYYCPNCERMYESGDHCPEDGTRLVRLKAAVDPLLGRNLDGRYTIIEKLGQGGMGAVYRGTQHSVGREVAIKVINAHLVSEPDAIRRFLREAKIASKLSHPNAVQVLEFGQTDDGLLYLVMELVSGRTLDHVVKSERVLKPERIVRIGTQVCDALEGAHALQIVHRDLKPANIMLLSSSRDLVKVLDFGLAKSVAPDQAATTMTNAGALLGTPAFMPPELALGQQCDGRADLYALGLILYLLGTGQLPFVSDSPHELIAMHGSDDPAPPMHGVPPGLAEVVDRLLQKDPARRFQSATETREALEACLGPRMGTPLPFASDTNPSIGPFPATASQFKHLSDTPSPSRRSATEMMRIASGDTVAVPSPAMQSMAETRSRRWLGPVLAVVALLAVGGGIFVATRGDTEKPASTPAPVTEPGSGATTLPEQAGGAVPTVDKTADKPATTVDEIVDKPGTTVDKAADKTVDKSGTTLEKPATTVEKPRKPPVRPTRPAVSKPAKPAVTQPPKPTQPPAPPKPGLPF